jgi:hypothetical protein
MKLTKALIEENNAKISDLHVTEDIVFASGLGTTELHFNISTSGSIKIPAGTNIIFKNLTFGTWLNSQESLKVKEELTGHGEAKVHKRTIVSGSAKLPFLDTNSFECLDYDIPVLKTKKSRLEKRRLEPTQYLHGRVLTFSEHAKDNPELFFKAYRNSLWSKLKIDSHLGELDFTALTSNGDIEVGKGNVIIVRTLKTRGDLQTDSPIVCKGDLVVSGYLRATAPVSARHFRCTNLRSSANITATDSIVVRKAVKASYLEAPVIDTENSEKLCVCGTCVSRKRKHCTTIANLDKTRCTCSWCTQNTKCLRVKK